MVYENVSAEAQKVIEQYESIVSKNQTLIIASSGDSGRPHVSYAPFLHIDDSFYVYITDLAEHTRNVLRGGEFEVMLIEDEVDAKNIYARKRVTCVVEATEMSDKSASYEILDMMEQKFGGVLAVLRGLGDFRLIKLDVKKRSIVLGFGKAFNIHIDSNGVPSVEHLRHT